MAFDFDGNGRVERYTALPASAQTFTACGWARIDAAETSGPGCIFECHLPDTSQHFFGSKQNSNSTVVAFLNYGAQASGDIWSPGAGNWFYWAIVNDDGEFSIYLAAQASTTWDATWQAPNPTTAFVPNRVAVGGNLYSPDEQFNGAIGLVKIWDIALTPTELLAQKFAAGPLVATSLLSSHLTDGPDVGSDLVADTGGSSADWTSIGTGTAYVANPSLVTTPTLTVAGQIIPVAVSNVAFGAAPAVLVGGSTSVSVTVTGTDGLPFEGLSVALTSGTPGVATVSGSPQVTNASGVATFTVNGIAVGTSVLTANADSGAATVTATASVAPATSVAVLTVGEPLIGTVGGTIAVQVTALGNNGLPLPGVSVSLASGTPAVATVAATPQTANGSGVASFTLNAIAAGTSLITASAAAGAVSDTAVAAVQTTVVPPVASIGSPWARLLRRP